MGIHAFYEPKELVGKALSYHQLVSTRHDELLSAINKYVEEEKLHLLMVDNHIPAGA